MVNNKEQTDLLEKLAKAVSDFDPDAAEAVATEYSRKGFDPLKGIEDGLVEGLDDVGTKFDSGEYFLPELIMGAEATIKGINILKPFLQESGQERSSKGKIVIGTVEGDLHDIGKTLVATLLIANGFEVEDLGAEVPTEDFVATVRNKDVDVLALSALLTSTMVHQREVIETLREEGLRNKVKVLIGGAPTSEEWRKEIGADAYGVDVSDGVKKVNQLLGSS